MSRQAHRFAGVSKALLAAMEEALLAAALATAPLISTVTAHRFYRSMGWSDVGESQRLDAGGRSSDAQEAS